MKDQIRAEFEQEFPLPNGVTFDGDHYVADPAVMGSLSNATIWSHMYRGWKRRQETLAVELPFSSYADEFIHTAEVARVTDIKSMLEFAGIRYVG